mmetsp:Transcript_13000/g.19601  ORF Transcript_13000/g.19601 Transcript_13000/m.19601 type:complete len:1143 (-) Transcript_13000:175-3603(-)
MGPKTIVRRVSIEEPARVGTANNILNEYYEAGNFQMLKQKHEHKFKKHGGKVDTCRQPVDMPRRSALKTPKTPGLGTGGSVHLGPLHVEDMHSVSDMLHRVTLQPGLEPGQGRVKTPADILAKAGHMGELQLKTMLGSDSIKGVLQEVVEVHSTIESVAQSLRGHRPGMGRNLEESNKLFLKLFQRMMSEILMMHRHKFQSQSKELVELRNRVSELESAFAKSTEESDIYRRRAEQAEIRIEELEAVCHAKKVEIRYLNKEIEQLRRQHTDFVHILELERKENEKLATAHKANEAAIVAKERETLQAMRLEIQMQVERENALHQAKILAAEERRILPKQADRRRQCETSDAETQTEVDDFGAFDRQNGWTLPIKGTVLARNLWRRASRYALCPSCRGTSKFLVKAAVSLQKLQRGELDDDPDLREYKSTGKWHVPDEIVQFMSNLPRSILTEKLWPLSKVVRYVWSLNNFKSVVDAEDASYGYIIQQLPQFIIETFLLRTTQRQEAERGIFLLMSSMKDHILLKKHPLLHTFARSLGVLDTVDADDVESGRHVSRSIRALVNQKGLIRTKNCSLPKSVLSVYLFARQCMLHAPYNGDYKDAIATAKSNSESLRKNQALLEGDDQDPEWRIKIPDHVCVTDKFHCWIPADRAVQVIKAILGFLSEKQMAIVLRHLEHSAMFLSSRGTIDETDGMHTVVRAVMRKLFMPGNTKGKTEENSPLSPAAVGPQTKMTVVVNMEKLLQAMIEMLLSRIRVVENELSKLYSEGDENGDGVLSFNEFHTIVSKTAKHFPSRRILKMFREALMHGNDDETIDEKSFVHVCKNHGLAQLVDINELKRTALAELHPRPSKAVKSMKHHVLRVAAEKNLRLGSRARSEKPRRLSVADVADAAMSANKKLRRQASLLKSEIQGDDETALRKNLSEELTPSSEEAARSMIDTLSEKIERRHSDIEDSVKKVVEIKSLHGKREKADSAKSRSHPRKLMNRMAGIGDDDPSTVLARIESQEELQGDDSVNESYIQIHRIASRIARNSRAHDSDSDSSVSSAASSRNPTMRKPNLTVNTDPDGDGQVIALRDIRKSICASPSVNSAISSLAPTPTGSGSSLSCGERNNASQAPTTLYNPTTASLILLGGDDDEPDLSDI